jgi:ferric-dicitrate binding protein FerR (iron transport regulator)
MKVSGNASTVNLAAPPKQGESKAMNLNDSERELLVRWLDGKTTGAEREQMAGLLKNIPEARAFVREVAEQSVMVADLERTAVARQQDREFPFIPSTAPRQMQNPVQVRFWQWGLAAAAAVVLLATTLQLLAGARTWIGTIAWVTGSSQVFGARGKVNNALPVGMRLSPGDTLETRSCDALVGLELKDNSSLVVVGKSALRILAADPDGVHFELGTGQLWVSPPDRPDSRSLFIRTPTLVVEAHHAQFYLQTTETETTVRINRGSAQVRQHVDGRRVDVPAGHQVTASLSRPQPLVAQPRSQPGNSWTCDLGNLPKSVLGRWLTSTDGSGARLGTVPLLWPLPDQKFILLHVAGMSVLANSERPVLLEAGAKLVFRGQTARTQTVRFGFVTQKPQGMFAGKFEIDVQPEALGPAGETWEVALPVAGFRPLQPELSFAPEGLELTDIYALTIQEDAGLEIHRVALLAGNTSQLPANR